MANHCGVVIVAQEEPPYLLDVPQELRDLILKEVLLKSGTILFDEYFSDESDGDGTDWPRRRRCCIKQSYCALSLSCKQLHKETMSIFFKHNTFELNDCGIPLAISDDCSRLIRKLDINVTFRVKARRLILSAEIKVRRNTITMDIEGKNWVFFEDGTEAVTGTTEHEYYAKKMHSLVYPCLKMLREALRTGTGIGIDQLAKVQRKVDRIGRERLTT